MDAVCWAEGQWGVLLCSQDWSPGHSETPAGASVTHTHAGGWSLWRVCLRPHPFLALDPFSCGQLGKHRAWAWGPEMPVCPLLGHALPSPGLTSLKGWPYLL